MRPKNATLLCRYDHRRRRDRRARALLRNNHKHTRKHGAQRPKNVKLTFVRFLAHNDPKLTPAPAPTPSPPPSTPRPPRPPSALPPPAPRPSLLSARRTRSCDAHNRPSSARPPRRHTTHGRSRRRGLWGDDNSRASEETTTTAALAARPMTQHCMAPRTTSPPSRSSQAALSLRSL